MPETNRMKYNPNIHHRCSIRLKGYNYSRAGLYFITICCQDRICCFGKIENDKMQLNDAGNIARECWLAIPKHFPNVVLHPYVVMPNHVHGIIEITVGANQHSPNNANQHSPENADQHGAKNVSNLPLIGDGNEYGANEYGAKNVSPLRSPSKTVGSMVRGFKIGVTKWMRQNTNVYHVWQRNYYEHIIRNETSYHKIADYIINNPANWENDKFHYQ